MSKIKFITLILGICCINSLINSIQTIVYKEEGIESSYIIGGKQTFELIFNSPDCVPENLQIKLKSLNNIEEIISFSTISHTCSNGFPFRGQKLDLFLEKSQLQKKNYLCISCEKSLICEFNLEITSGKKGMRLDEEIKNEEIKDEEIKEDEDDIILRATTSDKTIDLFTLDSTYKDILQIPKDRITVYQIPEGTTGKYRVTSGNTVVVNSFGTISPANTTWYWYGNMGTTSPQPNKTPTQIQIQYKLGTSVVSATIGDKEYKITVNVKDYGDEYVENKLNDYLKKNVTNQKTQLDKLKSITAYPAQFPYNYRYSGYKSMIIFGGGDCWASASTINYLCQKVGIKSHIRYAANDPGSGTGHRNVAALIDGKIYIAEAGYGYDTPNRPYHVTLLNIGYSIKSTKDGVIIYQYDGYDVNINIPSAIDGKTVIGLENPVFRNGPDSGKYIKSIKVPDTIQTIGDSVFNSLPNITTITIPKNVSKIGLYVFAGSDNLATINVDSSNKYFVSNSGILYNKTKTEIIGFPPGKKENYTGLSTLKKIGNYSFYYAKNIQKVTIPKGVTVIGDGAFGTSSIKEIYFAGDPPSFGQFCFHSLNVSIYYPKGNNKWKVESIDKYNAKEIRWIQWTPPSTLSFSNSLQTKYVPSFIIFAIIILVLSIYFVRRKSNKSKIISNIQFDSNGLLV